MKKEAFIDELAETVERLWADAPPVIILQGWWWKRYIPFFKRQQNVVMAMWESQWENGGRTEHKERMIEEKNRFYKSFLKKLA